MFRLLRILLLASSLSLAAPAFADSRDDAEIAHLMETFHVHDVVSEGMGSLLKSPAFQTMSPEKQACVARVFTVDLVFDEMKQIYNDVFNDAEMRGELIKFLDGPVGHKLIEGLYANRASGELSVLETFTDAEKAEGERFFSTPSGQLFITVQPKLLESLQRSIKKLVAVVKRECDPPPQS